MLTSGYSLGFRAAPARARASGQRLDENAVLLAADHEVRAGSPPRVLVEMPAGLHALHGRAAGVAGRGCKGYELGPGHLGHRGTSSIERQSDALRVPNRLCP